MRGLELDIDETFTAYIKKNGVAWLGWIPDLPEVKCEGETVEIVRKELHDILHQTLVAIEKAWDEQFEADVKAGRLEPFIEKARRSCEGRQLYKDCLNSMNQFQLS